MDWAQFIGAKSHCIPLRTDVRSENERMVFSAGSACYNSCPRRINVEPGESGTADKAGA